MTPLMDSAAPVVLAVRNLSRAGDYDDISFEVKAGEILGITGRLGSGRTELALSLFGMSPPDHGEILLLAKSLPRPIVNKGGGRLRCFVKDQYQGATRFGAGRGKVHRWPA